jgi:hypothetical protein
MTSTLDTLQPIFIVGTDKSGTSFLLSLLDSHPATITLFETYIYHFPQKKITNQEDFLGTVETFFAEQFKQLHQGFINKRVLQDAFLAEVKKRTTIGMPESVYKALFYAFLAVIRHNLGADAAQRLTHFVEKSPTHYRHADKIFADFPYAKIIHVLRDPRDNYLALKRRTHDRTSSQYANPRYNPANFIWNRLLASLNAAYQNVVRYGDQYRIVFYEDLILYGESLLRELVAWFGLAWHDALLVPSIDGEQWRGNSTAADLKGRLEPFDPRPIGRWKTELMDREIRLMEYLIRCYNLQSKYALTRHRTPLDLVWALLPPFQEERRHEKPQSRARFFWDYTTRRLLIALSLQKRALLHTDNRLIDASFVPKG